jgi:hypothetical protein
MPKKETIVRARRAEREGKSPSTQAGEFVREEIEAIRKGEHGARSTQQAKRELAEAEKSQTHKPSRKRSQATLNALKREGKAAASKVALSRHSRAMARKRTSAQKSLSAKKAAQTRKAKSGRGASGKAGDTR